MNYKVLKDILESYCIVLISLKKWRLKNTIAWEIYMYIKLCLFQVVSLSHSGSITFLILKNGGLWDKLGIAHIHH